MTTTENENASVQQHASENNQEQPLAQSTKIQPTLSFAQLLKKNLPKASESTTKSSIPIMSIPASHLTAGTKSNSSPSSKKNSANGGSGNGGKKKNNSPSGNNSRQSPDMKSTNSPTITIRDESARASGVGKAKDAERIQEGSPVATATAAAAQDSPARPAAQMLSFMPSPPESEDISANGNSPNTLLVSPALSSLSSSTNTLNVWQVRMAKQFSSQKKTFGATETAQPEKQQEAAKSSEGEHLFEKIVDATASVSLNADAQYEAQLSDGKASDVSLTPKSLAGGDAEDDAEDGSKQQESAENSPTAVGGSQMPMGTEYNPRHSSASPRYYSRGRGRGRGGMRSYNNNGGHHRSSNGSGGRYNNNGGHYSMQQYPQQQQQQYIPAGTTGYYQFVPVMDWETLKYCLMTQIEYYFSVENLCRDLFFRQKMDAEGFVPLSLIANFNRVKALSLDLNVIKDAIAGSLNLEMEDEKVRKRGDWHLWVLPAGGETEAAISAQEVPVVEANNAEVGTNPQ